MIIANDISGKGSVEIKVAGYWPSLMAEYKAITDYFLEHHFDDFMAAMEKWNDEVSKK